MLARDACFFMVGAGAVGLVVVGADRVPALPVLAGDQPDLALLRQLARRRDDQSTLLPSVHRQSSLCLYILYIQRGGLSIDNLQEFPTFFPRNEAARRVGRRA